MITSLRTRLGASSSFAVAIVAVAVLLFPATAGAQQVARRFGVGVGIGDVHNIFATSAVVTTEDTVAAPAVGGEYCFQIDLALVLRCSIDIPP